MSRRTVVLASLAATMATLIACKGFKDAMTAHVDVVARAGSQELSVNRLATLIGESKLPVDRDFLRQVAGIWVDYQLLGHAAAQNDSLDSPQTMDSALWGLVTNAKAKKWFDQMSKTWVGADSLKYPGEYAEGNVLAAKHILLAPKPGDTSSAASDSLHRKATALRAQLTAANFSDMASKNSQDPGSARQGGSLGVFKKGQMVAPFEQALVALKPGQISQPVHTQFGWHIIYRPTYEEVKGEVAKEAGQQTMQKAESAYVASLDSASHLKFTPTAAATVRAVAKDPSSHRADRTPIATYAGTDFTAARLSRWMDLFPPQLRMQLQQAADSQLPTFVRNVIRNEMVIRQADSAHVTLDSTEMSNLRHTYEQLITGAWQQLGVDPKQLADSAKSAAGREKLAAAHVEDYLNRMVAMTARYIDVPQPVDQALRSKYQAEINDAGIDRALAEAQSIRKKSDSTRDAKAPATAVPLPGSTPAGPGAGGPGATPGPGAKGAGQAPSGGSGTPAPGKAKP